MSDKVFSREDAYRGIELLESKLSDVQLRLAELMTALKESEFERLEQARLLGISGSKEAVLSAKLAEVEVENSVLREQNSGVCDENSDLRKHLKKSMELGDELAEALRCSSEGDSKHALFFRDTWGRFRKEVKG